MRPFRHIDIHSTGPIWLAELASSDTVAYVSVSSVLLFYMRIVLRVLERHARSVCNL